VTLTLVDVSPTRREAGFESYSLTFRAAADHPFPQGMFPVSHPVFGDFDLFLVPTLGTFGQRTAGWQYEACFNRLLASEP
jgi:hypothetical protein